MRPASARSSCNRKGPLGLWQMAEGYRLAMSVIDPLEVVETAGLRHVDPGKLPILRKGAGRGFRYIGRGGKPVSDSVKRRIEQLAVPPAWSDVRIASDPAAHIQAVGVDDAGRTQYRYHPGFRAAADALKYARLGTVGERLPRLRETVAELLPGDGGLADAAAVVRLIDRTLLRVGSERYVAENGTFGASTLRRRHVVSARDGLRLRFVSKGGVERDLPIDDDDLAAAIDRCAGRCRRDDDRLFSGPDGGVLSGSFVADCLSEWAGVQMTAKELRTWGASTAMIVELMEPVHAREADTDDPVLAAYDGVAFRLGNTREVTRSAYVCPRVVEAHESGRLADLWRRSRRSSRFERHEQCGRKLFA